MPHSRHNNVRGVSHITYHDITLWLRNGVSIHLINHCSPETNADRLQYSQAEADDTKVKPVLGGHSEIDKTKILMTNLS